MSKYEFGSYSFMLLTLLYPDLNYSITYSDGSQIQANQELKANNNIEGIIDDLELINEVVRKKGKINAIVQGSSSKPYEVCVNIEVLNKEKIEDIVKLCENKIESIEDLINGKFPDTLKEVFIGKNGLFPSPDEIKFDCSCPDYASLCKHIASVLYAIGAKFDTDPRLFFELRGIDVNQLIKKAVDNSIEKLLVEKNKSERVIAEEDIDRIFGI